MPLLGNARAAGICAAVVAVASAARADEGAAEIHAPAAIPIHVPDEVVSPELAVFASGAALVVGVAWGTILFTSTSSASGTRPQLPAFAVVATTLVIAPSLGRWMGGDVETAAVRTGTRLLVAGVASAAALYGFDEGSGGPHPIPIAVVGLLTPIVIAHALNDIAATSRDLRLDRAVRALTVSPLPRGTAATFTASF
jgi:hypothetical protein